MLARPGARAVLTANKLEILIEAALVLRAEIMLPEILARRELRFSRLWMSLQQSPIDRRERM
ncbi:MAG TPA: hypothetical protein VD840_12375 [Sinorhizobium sp.]|nr:hypothetical protein [Sinorhizobium sp.]